MRETVCTVRWHRPCSYQHTSSCSCRSYWYTSVSRRAESTHTRQYLIVQTTETWLLRSPSRLTAIVINQGCLVCINGIYIPNIHGRRPRARPKKQWLDYMKEDCDLMNQSLADATYLACYRKQWKSTICHGLPTTPTTVLRPFIPRLKGRKTVIIVVVW